MLEQVLNHIRNYFEKEIVSGTYVISSGTLQVDFLKDNQYFRIVGSVFNDGVHKYPSDELVDETFDGSIWAMAVPPAVVALCDDIEAWEAKYGGIDGALMSPFSSESFGGYSYTKKSSNGQTIYNNDPSDWRSVFRSRLNVWRKI